MLFRCIIKFECKKFFIGKTFYNKWFIIIKNEHSVKFKVGNDFNFFAERKGGLFIDKLIPLNEEEVVKQHSMERNKGNRNRLTPSMG